MTTIRSIFRAGTIAGCIFGLASMAIAFSVHAGSPRPIGDIGLDPDLGALVHKEKSRQQVVNKGANYASDDPANPCGTISINSNNQTQRGGSARPGRQNVTVVTGPVLNVANCK